MVDYLSVNNSVGLIVWGSIGITVLIVLLVVWRVLLPLARNSSQNNRLMRTGVSAQAIIIRTWDTGVLVNNSPNVGFELEVHPTDQPAYRATTQKIVSFIHIGMFQPGMPVEVRYDPANPSKVAIVSAIPQTYNSAGFGNSTNRY